MIEILKKIPFFSELSDEDLQQIVDKIKLEYFPANHVIFEQEAPGAQKCPNCYGNRRRSTDA